ncbi:hypothetical protein MLD38_029619 [Melastoma candidum]|uniref:Uncharacterized protein n=1 Tax=Melastoma candidum TaxID=119954 RepID=A0ACB9N6T4_9MYRT|nr:hypothetical protein MLD38_029619 [Melastoma candidum]
MSSSTGIICCPIELEPRTLSQVQLNHAREAAADVVGKMEPAGATTIFTEGLKPVRTSKEMERSIELAGLRDRYECGGDDMESSEEEKLRRTKEKTCECSCKAAAIDSSDEAIKIKEPASSPF